MAQELIRPTIGDRRSGNCWGCWYPVAGVRIDDARNYLDFFPKIPYATRMQFLTILLTNLQAAIAVVAARDRGISAFLVLVWGRIAVARTKLERLVALWRAGCLPAGKVRLSRAGMGLGVVRAKSVFPTGPAWLLEHVREAGAYGSQLEHLLTGEEAQAFVAACPQAGRILRSLGWMLGAGNATGKVRRASAAWVVRETVPVVAPAGLVLGPRGRVIWV